MRVYISGPLQGAVDLASARKLYESIAEILVGLGHAAYVPHLNTDPEFSGTLSGNEVFSCDRRALMDSGAVIAHIGLASTGAGAEIAMAAASGRPVLGIKRPGERSSRFIEGLIDEAGGSICDFASEVDLRDAIEMWLGHVDGHSFHPISIDSGVAHV